MRAVTVWMIAGLGALALLEAADEKDQEKIDLLNKMSGCCKTSKRVESVFEYGDTKCGGKFILDKLRTPFRKKKNGKAAPDLRNNCFMECMFQHNGLLSFDKKIKQTQLREDITKKAVAKGVHGDVKSVVGRALSLCSQSIRANEAEMVNAQRDAAKGAGKRECNRAPLLVMSCITDYLLLNCVESEWQDGRQECAGKRTTIKQDVRKSEKKQPEESHKEVSENRQAAESQENENSEDQQAAAEFQENENSEDQQAAAEFQENENSEDQQAAEWQQTDHSLEMSAEQNAASDLVQPANTMLNEEQQEQEQ